MPKKKTLEEFLKEIKEKRPDLEYISGYQSSTKPIKVKSNICEHIWDATPKNLLNNNSGCPKCASNNKKIAHKYTHEQFCELIAEKFENIEIISKYKGMDYLITYRCSKCGKTWRVKARSLMDGRSATHAQGCGTGYYPAMNDEQLKHDFESGMTRTEIAEKYGCVVTTVSNRLNALGLYYRKNGKK